MELCGRDVTQVCTGRSLLNHSVGVEPLAEAHRPSQWILVILFFIFSLFITFLKYIMLLIVEFVWFAGVV